MFDSKTETLNRDEIEKIQLTRLQNTVKRVYENTSFYKTKLDELGIKPEDIKSLKDIQKLPFTTKADLRDNYPFALRSCKKEEVIRIHASSGTTGNPTVTVYTENDLNIWSDCVARLIAGAGVTGADVAQVSFGYGLFTGAFGLHQGLEKIGCSVIPMSSGNSEKQLKLMVDFEATVLVATPSYAIYLSELVKEAGIKDKLKLRVGLFGAEGCTVEMREQIEKNLGVKATDNYGMTELMGPGVSGDCEFRCGMHIAEDHFIAEIINPDTGEVLKKGESGELVITTITREGMPLLRYRTRDITNIDYSPCKCGRTHARMSKIRGRSDDMLIIKGVNVFPSQIESVLVGMEHVAPHYQLVVTREGFMDSLQVNVELVDESLLEKYSALEALRTQIVSKLRSTLGLETKVNLVEPKTLERFQGKAKRVLDLRNT